jgi:GT2 family glycosyltransferase
VSEQVLAASPFGCAPGRLDGQAPVAVRCIDIETTGSVLELPRSRSGMPYHRMLGLVRRHGAPLGWVALPVAADGTVSLNGLAGTSETVGDAADTLAGRDGPDGLIAHSTDEAAEAHDGEALLSIVVATCANVQSATRCVEAILESATGPFEVIVVENRPARSTVGPALAERFSAEAPIRYVEEERPGLSHARNAGLALARGELVAFTDDDVVVDEGWVPAIRKAFAARPDVGCVTGLILPLEFETPTQLMVERFASFGKGFTPRIYSLQDPPADQPLFPYTAGYFGSGANMAFRSQVLRDLGGFDPVLGTGTRARGGEDLDICIRLLHSGVQLAYEPRAIVWHRHPETEARLRRQVFDYGAGLGAMLSKQLVTGPNRWRILRHAPQGIRYYTDPLSRKNVARGSVFPRRLSRLERAGLLYGPAAYLASRVSTGR